ncbi:hypothetical protein IYZ83_005855 [Wolbachia pipientis]|uniref:hypothetical protein n=1 Tax=Wolbachia pipientis TaxID=955 RepID=UPI001BD94CB1|nr:hypothetical protein [Wolbachia pipientis]UIP91637.1 hypothetical protein IYZ83_005855 [Wolbachia pipientis]
MDVQELENLQESSSTKSQDAEEKTSEELERNLNPNEASASFLVIRVADTGIQLSW